MPRKKLVFTTIAILLFFFGALSSAFGDESNASGSLLNLANEILKSDVELNAKRENIFRMALNEQKALFNKSEERLVSAESNQARLKQKFDENEKKLADLENKLTQRTGSLGEVFGVAKEGALDFLPILNNSLASAEYPGRESYLEFAKAKGIPTAKNFSDLVNVLNSELNASGDIVDFDASVVNADGILKTQQVRRFGVFSSINQQGDYLEWDASQKSLNVLATQPSHDIKSFLDSPDVQQMNVLIDPSRGELFAMLDREPTFRNRIEQGGAVGYLIIALGVLGILVSLVQIVRLMLTELSVRKQLLSSELLTDKNPLGRVLKSINTNNETSSNEMIEMRVDEAVLKELPKLEQGQSFLKLLAAVAPLLGLLGTVVGMIATFQSITLFGTSDPKLMANGISQALMTTVLGLVVAVPVLFFHSLLVSRSKRLIQILQEKSLGALVLVASTNNDEDSSENRYAA